MLACSKDNLNSLELRTSMGFLSRKPLEMDCFVFNEPKNDTENHNFVCKTKNEQQFALAPSPAFVMASIIIR